MGLFTDILEACVTRLTAQEYFVDVPIIAMGVGETAAKHIEERVRANVNRAGLSVEIAFIGAATQFENQPGPHFDVIRLVARVIEKPSINLAKGGIGKRASDIAGVIAHWLHQYSPPVDPETTEPPCGIIILGDAGIVPAPDDEFHIFDVNLRTHAGYAQSTP